MARDATKYLAMLNKGERRKRTLEIWRRVMMRMFLIAAGSILAGSGFVRGVLEKKTDDSYLWIALMLVGLYFILTGCKPREGG